MWGTQYLIKPYLDNPNLQVGVEGKRKRALALSCDIKKGILEIMSYVKVMIHTVWGTKNRAPLITSSIKNQLISHIRENARKKNIYIDTVNSQPDHVHCLFSLNATMSVSTALNLMKGEASRWANKENLIKPKLDWADDYFAASVSESQLPKVRAYILNQDEHHRKITFEEEYRKFITAYGLKNENTAGKTESTNRHG